MEDTFEIGGVVVGRNNPPFILAEIGINHQGDKNAAIEMIARAASAGAHGVKFQSFTADKLAHQEYAKDQYELFHPLELDEETHHQLHSVAKEYGIAFVSTPFDTDWALRLANMKVDAIKIASGDLSNLPLLDTVATLGLPVILSTGMGYSDEIERAYNRLLNGGVKKLVILHCVSLYPTLPKELNLDAMKMIMDIYQGPVGLSDHTVGSWAAIAATALGASFIEKHFTLDKNRPGYDHVLSVTPEGLHDLVVSTEQAHGGIGSRNDKPCAREIEKRKGMRRGLYAAHDIVAGKQIALSDISVLRPEATIGPEYIYEVIGSKACMNFKKGEPLTLR